MNIAVTTWNTRDLERLFETIEFRDAFRLTYLGNAIINPAYEAIRREFGLIRPEYTLLACLSHYSELTAQDVATISRQPRNTISRAVHRDPDDARQSRLRITPKGRALHESAALVMQQRQEEVLGGLDEDERDTLSRLLLKSARFAASLKY